MANYPHLILKSAVVTSVIEERNWVTKSSYFGNMFDVVAHYRDEELIGSCVYIIDLGEEAAMSNGYIWHLDHYFRDLIVLGIWRPDACR